MCCDSKAKGVYIQITTTFRQEHTLDRSTVHHRTHTLLTHQKSNHASYQSALSVLEKVQIIMRRAAEDLTGTFLVKQL